MSPTLVIILVVVVLLVVAGALLAVRASRRKRLQEKFGPEYDRVVSDAESRTAGEKELLERQRRHEEFPLKALSAESKQTYSVAWEEVQIQFVDAPEQAVTTADALVTRLIAERGYPTNGSYDDRLATLSVEHARTLEHYRDAHAISERNTRGEADTEELRQALVHYRALFADLLGTNPVPEKPASQSRETTDQTINNFHGDTTTR